MQVARLLDPVHMGRRRRPACLVGDKVYSTRTIRAWARRHHGQLIVPEHIDQIAHWAHRPGRKPRFDRAIYRGRNVAERAVGWLEHRRRPPPGLTSWPPAATPRSA